MANSSLATLGPTIDSAGISIPAYEDILATLQARYQSIYGSDAYLGEDSQDGQWVAIIAAAINDANAAMVLCYNNFSPSRAVGEGLSSVIKINGLTRKVPTYSTVSLLLTGDTGTIIVNGEAKDDLGNVWLLPSSVTIPSGGTITVTATAENSGAIRAPSGTITVINTPVRGWTSVTNPSAAAVGIAVEQDATLRRRQAASRTFSSVSPVASIYAAVAAVAGVSVVKIYENYSDATNALGIPAHTIAILVVGGADADVALAILASRQQGCGMVGTTSVTLTNDTGVTEIIQFQRPTEKQVYVNITLEALTNYSTAVGDALKASLADYITNQISGDFVYWSRLWGPANISDSYHITAMTIAFYGGVYGTADLPLAYYETPVCEAANIVITVSN